MSDKAEFFLVRRSSTALSNAVIHNNELSLPALGVLMVCLSLPPNAPAGYRAFLNRGMGEKAVRKALQELEAKNHRFRFRLRRKGQLREVTIVADTPISPDEAREEITGMMATGVIASATIGECVSHPDPEVSTGETEAPPVDNHRAADVAARSDQRQHSSTVPCASAARSSAAHTSNEVSKNSSLHSEFPSNQPAAQPPDDGVGGRDDPPSQKLPGEPQSEADGPDWQLITACLPAPMRTGLTTAAGTRITAALRHAQATGWTTGAIYRQLNANPWPSQPDNPAGLAIHRVTELSQSPAPATPSHRPATPPPGPAEPTGPMPDEVRQQLQELVARLRAKHAAAEKSDQHNKTETETERKAS